MVSEHEQVSIVVNEVELTENDQTSKEQGHALTDFGVLNMAFLWILTLEQYAPVERRQELEEDTVEEEARKRMEEKPEKEEQRMEKEEKEEQRMEENWKQKIEDEQQVEQRIRMEEKEEQRIDKKAEERMDKMEVRIDDDQQVEQRIWMEEAGLSDWTQIQLEVQAELIGQQISRQE